MGQDLIELSRWLAQGMVRPDLIELFERFEHGEQEAVLGEFGPYFEYLSDDLVWDSTELEVPDIPPILRGRQAPVEFFLAWLSVWDDFGWTTDNYERVGDDAVVYDIHIHARSRVTQLPSEMHLAHRLTFRDGKLAEWRLFREREDALQTQSTSISTQPPSRS